MTGTPYRLLSLPPDLVGSFHSITDLNAPEWYCTSDPAGVKIGSGGGTAWLVDSWLKDTRGVDMSDPKIIIHAGGQSRRLPAYAPVGKILTPVPVFRWERGQLIDQSLLSLQLPLYERILAAAPPTLPTLIASGDVYIRAEKPLTEIPEADVVCYGLWVDASLATHHGVFVSSRSTPTELDFMLQKPSLDRLEELSRSHMFLMDIGIWLLSDRAMKLLRKRSVDADGNIGFYDLYSDFGRALGSNPTVEDDEVNRLTVAILPLPGGEFYHFGTSRELMSSTLALQNKVVDQRKILQRKVKANPSLFVQNALMGYRLSSDNDNVWVENSSVPASWTLRSDHIITGVPENAWSLDVPSGVCVDIVPVGDASWAVRPYGLDDPMRGDLDSPDTVWMGAPFVQWRSSRGVDVVGADIQASPIFPVVDSVDDMYEVLQWMITGGADGKGKEIWLSARKLSADQISAHANLTRLFRQRNDFLKANLEFLAWNYEKSVFYQLDLNDVASRFVTMGIKKPELLPQQSGSMTRIRNYMVRSRIDSMSGRDGSREEMAAFELLRDEILSELKGRRPHPRLNVYSDQIVWGRSPVRIDLAGGWTDTPPYSLYTGGSVVNMAIELNGQQPLQVYVKPSSDYRIVLRSIDLGASEIVEDFESLSCYHTVGSPFSIPKAALTLAGFAPRTSSDTLTEFLHDFGSGIEITLLSAIPAGSGLGTSSILAATVLGALSEFCGIGWDEGEISHRTLALEQLLTTGGGWQDQYGGVLGGVKLLRTEEGITQRPSVSWLPSRIFTSTEFKPCHLLYYTGLTRTAKGILAEIVRGMFLNSNSHLSILSEMRAHSLATAEAIQRNDFHLYGRMIAKTWSQNKRLDSGTEPPAVADIVGRVSDLTLGYKLPGAGGGGYLYMVAKDPQAAARIRSILTECPPNSRARFVEMTLSDTGFQVSRS